MKRFLYALFILSLISAVIFWTNRLVMKSQKVNTEILLPGLPKGAVAVVVVPHPDKFLYRLRKMEIAPQFVKNELLNQNLTQTLMLLDSLNDKNSQFKKAFAECEISVSMHHAGLGGYKPLIVIRFNKQNSADAFYNWFAQQRCKAITPRERFYKNVKLNLTEELHNSTCYSYYLYNTVFALSSSDLLLERSAAALTTGIGLGQDRGFNDVYNTRGKNALANLFLNPQLFQRMIGKDQKEPLSFDVSGFADWMGLDLYLDARRVMLSGFISGTKTQNWGFTLLGQKSDKTEWGKILPSNAASVSVLNISDYNTYLAAIHSFQPKFIDWQLSAAETMGTNPVRWFQQYFAGTAALVTFTGNDSHARILLLKTMYAKEAVDDLRKLAGVKSISVNTVGGRIQCATFMIPDFFKFTLGGWTYDFSPQLVSTYNGYLVFAENETAVKCLHEYSPNTMALADCAAYSSVCDPITYESVFYSWANSQRIKQFLQSFVPDDILTAFIRNNAAWPSLVGGSFQLSPSGKGLFVNIILKCEKSESDEAAPVWQMTFENGIKRIAGGSENRPETSLLMVQDSKNWLYLISGSGLTKWKRLLPGSVSGRTIFLPEPASGTEMAVFATSDQLFVVDANSGTDIAGFPVAIKPKITAGIGSADYNNDKDYRFFVPLSNGTIALYDGAGKVVSGWNFSGLKDDIVADPKHLRVADKDYIAVIMRHRVAFYDRKGAVRVVPQQKLRPAVAGTSVYASNNTLLGEPGFLYANDLGEICFVGIDGAVSAISVFNQIGSIKSFYYADVNHDGDNEMVVSGQNEIRIYSSAGKLLIAKVFENTTIENQVFVVMDEPVFLVSEKDKQILHLLKPDCVTELLPPVKGGLPACILNNGNSVFVVCMADEKNMQCFSLSIK